MTEQQNLDFVMAEAKRALEQYARFPDQPFDDGTAAREVLQVWNALVSADGELASTEKR